MAWTNTVMLTLSLVFGLTHMCAAGSGLRGGPTLLSERVSVEEVQRSLLEEINEALNVSVAHQETRVKQFESELAITFAALPKNEKGGLAHAAVHYALHRLFIERHGWFFKGLEPSGASRSSLTPVGILKDRVPSYIQDLFEEQMGKQGFALRELAVLAATLEHLVNNEAHERLRQTFQLLELPIQDRLPKDKFEEVLDTFMAAQITKTNVTAASRSDLSDLWKSVSNRFPDWPEAQDVIREAAAAHGSSMDFDAASNVVSKASKSLGRWYKGRCQSKKERLISLGDRQVGRIPLSSFYAAALSGPGQQAEHIDYLRELGALDESLPRKPTVLVTNYMISPANCFVASSFYSICCANACEGLMRHLESEVAAPTAKPARIQHLLAHLPSSVVTAPRELPDSLLKRLEEIAGQHGGDVPIHGRLFSQWLHHAYPRECPYPHAAGTTHPQTADEWMAETGKESAHTKDEIQEFVNHAAELEAPGEGDDTNPVVLPWSDEEELLVVRPASWTMLEPVAEEVANSLLMQPQPLRLVRYIVFVLALSMMCLFIKQQISRIVGFAGSEIGPATKFRTGECDRYMD